MQTDRSVQFIFENEMKIHNLRQTHVRKAIFDKLLISDKPISIQTISKSIDNAHFVSIYRSVDSLLKAGIVKQVPQGFKNLFELSDIFKPHHHHATCEKCGMTTEVHDERVEKLMKELTIKSGLMPTKHHFEMYGICKKCKTTR